MSLEDSHAEGHHPEKLVISGPDITGQIETTDEKAIAPSIWGGSRVAYVVYYVWDPDAGRALVYIPGSDDESYRVNASSILRDGSDGRSWRDGQWYVATDDWSRAIRDVLERKAAVVAAR